MALDREAIYTALFERLKTECVSFSTFTRKDRTLAAFSTVKQPALVLFALDETVSPQPNMRASYTLNGAIVLLAKTAQTEESPETRLNALLLEVETALERKDADVDTSSMYPGQERHWTNLGGLVARCWISGRVDIEQGAESGQGMVRIPVEIIAG